ncbi:uncharacterized protein PFL1_03940 [Pseudozyma flocculosa PF-1]|uniref:Related to ATO3 - plasma membrane protein with possible role in export of ammonia n=2 Tax=Pseudozyma flocculosa TaxID=84751 RepID=A0A5C3EWG1_9BASI|nr:uncharacterized protein PFL1_03940 [Pseudozyma flocculosa PF-1]EPQ28637.1 hypothetical protein PFL1_03940 [Pseudozyma flocculosa PF-1]SPO36583.1 related to ATO3 - plasma membrane protein with possible role in export of ammonia [Pseudozyma flocculosa]
MSSSSEKIAMEGDDHNTRYVHADGASDVPLNRQISVMLTQQQFEQLYLQPQIKSSAQAQNIKTFGNPTIIGIISFLLSFSPTTVCLMGWHGTTSASTLALMPAYYLLSGIGLALAGVLEWFLGNTLPSVIFSAAITQDATVYGGGLGFYLLFWALYCFIGTAAALRTNVTFVWILFFVACTFTFLSASYLSAAKGLATAAANLQTAGGAVGFVACVGGWWMLLHLALAAGDMPFNVPLGDLSTYWKKRE